MEEQVSAAADIARGHAPARAGRRRRGRLAALLRGAGLVLALHLAAPVHAQPAPDLDAAQAMLAEGRAEEVYQLLAPHEAQLAGDLRYDYLLARSALDSGKPSIASFIYERILAIEPNYAGVRLENGRAYLELQDYARAKQEFETVLRFDNLPPDLKVAAEQYLQATEERLTPRRTFHNAYAEYGFGYDSNVNSAIAEAVVPLPGGLLLLLDPLSTEQGDFYNALSAGGEVLHRFDEHWQVFGGIDFNARFHLDETLFDYQDVNARLGMGYSFGNNNVRLFANGGRFFIDDSRLRDLSGLNADWLHALDASNQITVSANYQRYRFPDQLDVLDFDAYGVTVGWNHAFAEGRGLLGVTGNLGYENSKGERLDGDEGIAGLGLTLQGVLTSSISAYAYGNVQRGQYDERNPLFLVTRHDTLYRAGGGVSWSFHKGWTLGPQVGWSKSASNIPLNDYDRLDVSLRLRGNF